MGIKDMNVTTLLKIRKFCRVFRMVMGAALIATGFITGIYWFYLGIIPFLAGALDFCPLCIISGKCDVSKN